MILFVTLAVIVVHALIISDAVAPAIIVCISVTIYLIIDFYFHDLRLVFDITLFYWTKAVFSLLFIMINCCDCLLSFLLLNKLSFMLS